MGGSDGFEQLFGFVGEGVIPGVKSLGDCRGQLKLADFSVFGGETSFLLEALVAAGGFAFDFDGDLGVVEAVFYYAFETEVDMVIGKVSVDCVGLSPFAGKARLIEGKGSGEVSIELFFCDRNGASHLDFTTKAAGKAFDLLWGHRLILVSVEFVHLTRSPRKVRQ